ncbi:MAG: signal peptidase I [Dysgonamonadaceae bacterium]|jgi:signal peptidase I|nr:signal peptidase I [Dysgonamonadaceae bacterium]
MIRSILKNTLKFILYIFLSLLLALCIRLFLCNFYRVPSDSMSPGIITGDFIMVEKWTYGGRILTRLKFGCYEDPSMIRVPGFGHVRHNDVVLFNFPYRDYHAPWDTIRMAFNMCFVKRCIGLPGDSLSAIGGYYRVAGLADTLGYIPEQKQMMRYQRIAPGEAVPYLSAFDSTLQWSTINFGPLYIPAAGVTIALTPYNINMYRKQIVYETRAAVRVIDSVVYINDTVAHSYTFCNNWYFMAGDNVMNSQDSRHIGLIPEAYVVGRASVILSSKDMYTGKRRWNRMLKRIK